MTDMIPMIAIVAIAFVISEKLKKINARLDKLEGNKPAQQPPREP